MNRAFIYIILLFITVNAFSQDGEIPGKKDSVTHVTRQYRLNDTYTGIVELPLDTLIGSFHRYKRTEKISPFFQHLGNYGLPYVETDFFDRPLDPENFIYRHLRYYMHYAANKRYIDTHVPFTELKWTYAGERDQAEQTLGVRHSQNVNPFLNIGLDLDIIYSLGQYSYQKSDDRAFTLHSSYTGKKYQAFASWSINNLMANENGGVSDPGALSEYDTDDVPVNLGGLNEAKSTIKNMNLQLIQKYTIGKGGKTYGADSLKNEQEDGLSGTFSHILEYEKGSRFYLDNNPGSGFYDTIYINNDVTFDSLYARVMRNTLRFDFSTRESARFQLGIGIGLANEQNVFFQIMPTHEEEITADSLRWARGSNAALGTLFGKIGAKLEWHADGKLYLSGLRAGDFEVKGRINKSFNEEDKKSELELRGNIHNAGPSWWMNNWGGNHFEWTNDFNKELRINIGGSFEYPGIGLDAGIDYALITNMLYFDNRAMPAQHDAAVSVIAARLNKNFSLWKLRFDNNLLFQKSSNSNVLDLPLVSARTAFYFDHEFYFAVTDGRLQTQLGFEAEYKTAYYSYAYMPATGAFYNQREIRTGNYPVINVFANIKLKRTRIFVSFDHVNHGLTGYDYFASPNYPMTIRMFKYGLAWTFYN